MAKNKITYARDYDERSHRDVFIFTGSQRQPTLAEVLEYIEEKRLYNDHNWPSFLVTAITVHEDSFMNVGFMDDDGKLKELVLWSYEGGTGDGSCPICGHEHDLSGDKCPVCKKPW